MILGCSKTTTEAEPPDASNMVKVPAGDFLRGRDDSTDD